MTQGCRGSCNKCGETSVSLASSMPNILPRCLFFQRTAKYLFFHEHNHLKRLAR